MVVEALKSILGVNCKYKKYTESENVILAFFYFCFTKSGIFQLGKSLGFLLIVFPFL